MCGDRAAIPVRQGFVAVFGHPAGMPGVSADDSSESNVK